MATELSVVESSFIAGLAASVACGLGVIPLWIRRLRLTDRVGLGFAFAGGLMMAASMLSLLAPAQSISSGDGFDLLQIVIGILIGGWLLGKLHTWLSPERLNSRWLSRFGSRTGVLIFVVMALHSVPEGIAVGVGYSAEIHSPPLVGLGSVLALAIAVHNIPEGLAVALPLHANGTSLGNCFLLAVCSSLPQPLAALPASYLVWCFEPLMLPLLGVAAGAMIFLVIIELLPESLQTESRCLVSWAFTFGAALMMVVQGFVGKV